MYRYTLQNRYDHTTTFVDIEGHDQVDARRTWHETTHKNYSGYFIVYTRRIS